MRGFFFSLYARRHYEASNIFPISNINVSQELDSSKVITNIIPAPFVRVLNFSSLSTIAIVVGKISIVETACSVTRPVNLSNTDAALVVILALTFWKFG